MKKAKEKRWDTMRTWKRLAEIGFLTAMFVALGSGVAMAEEEAISPAMFTVNNLWLMIAAGLVFIMHLGFATLESGLTQAKNTTNILFKNTFIVSVGVLTYALSLIHI